MCHHRLDGEQSISCDFLSGAKHPLKRYPGIAWCLRNQCGILFDFEWTAYDEVDEPCNNRVHPISIHSHCAIFRIISTSWVSYPQNFESICAKCSHSIPRTLLEYPMPFLPSDPSKHGIVDWQHCLTVRLDRRPLALSVDYFADVWYVFQLFSSDSIILLDFLSSRIS